VALRKGEWEMSENQNEEAEQSGPAEEPEVEGFGSIVTTRSNIKSSAASMGLGASDFSMKKMADKDRLGLARKDPGAKGNQ
jgi:hypothetical protein